MIYAILLFVNSVNLDLLGSRMPDLIPFAHNQLVLVFHNPTVIFRTRKTLEIAIFFIFAALVFH